MSLKSTRHGTVDMRGAQLLVLSQVLYKRGDLGFSPFRGCCSTEGWSAPCPEQADLQLPILPLVPPNLPWLPPQVLIVVPFREAALRVVQLFISLLEGDSKKKIIVSNKKRFKGEYGSDPEERPPNLKRPEDYEAVFVGNIDDHFRIGNSSSSELRPQGTYSVRFSWPEARSLELGILSVV